MSTKLQQMNELLRKAQKLQEQIERFNAMLAKVQANDPSVRVLDLAHQDLAEGDVMQLVEALKTNTHVEVLDLDGNFNVGPVGASALGAMLEVNTKLQTLILSRCYICEAGTVAIANALRVNNTLQVLNLGHNFSPGISARPAYIIDAIEPLALALQSNIALRSLDLSHNGIVLHLADRCMSLLQNNSGLKVLDLSGNELDLRYEHPQLRIQLRENFCTKVAISRLEQITLSRFAIVDSLGQRGFADQLTAALQRSTAANTCKIVIKVQDCEEHETDIVFKHMPLELRLHPRVSFIDWQGNEVTEHFRRDVTTGKRAGMVLA